jgi:hypothetical protein
MNLTPPGKTDIRHIALRKDAKIYEFQITFMDGESTTMTVTRNAWDDRVSEEVPNEAMTIDGEIVTEQTSHRANMIVAIVVDAVKAATRQKGGHC